MSTKRFLWLTVVLTFVGLVAGMSWYAGSRIESPAEAAARTAPPPPSPILVPVERKILGSNVVTRGTARFGIPQAVAIAPSTLKLNPGLITTLPKRNTQLAEGDVMLTASGRPVFVLQGEIPAYRDLVPGISGKDVLQLEQGLQRLGFDPGPIDDTYDKQTSDAVAKWYESTGNGWKPFGPTLDQLARIRTLEQDLATARKNELATQAAVETAQLTLESARATADHANQLATEDAEAAITALRKNEMTTAAAVTNAKLALEAARATAEHAYQLAVAEVNAALAARDQTGTDGPGDQHLIVHSARAAAEHAEKAARAEIATRISDRALVTLDPRATQSARAAADAQLEVARANLEAAQLKNQVDLQTAQLAAQADQQKIDMARAAVKAKMLENKLAIQAALDAQKAAEFDAEQARQKANRAASEKTYVHSAAVQAKILESKLAVQSALDAQQLAEFDAKLAKQQADRLAADLELAQRSIGVQVPVDEIVFIPSLPVRVHELTGVVGDAATGPVMQVTDNQLAIDSSLALDAAPLVKAGMAVEIDEQALGIRAKGVVKRVASTPGTFGVDGYHIYFEVQVTETLNQLEGFSLRLTIPIKSTNEMVTAVPNSALWLSADGTSRIQVQNGAGLEYVEVRPGLSADGYVEVTPVAGSLEPGQLVVIGFESNQEPDPS